MTDEAKQSGQHMQFLRPIAETDLEVLAAKEATYHGSWKRRGGVGAFMMLARKWDRLESLVERAGESTEMHARPWDVFVAIDADPSGQDGSALAEVRDLRRYLLLVEAEMVARGVVTKTGAPPVALKEAFNRVAAQLERQPQTEPSEPVVRFYASAVIDPTKTVPAGELIVAQCENEALRRRVLDLTRELNSEQGIRADTEEQLLTAQRRCLTLNGLVTRGLAHLRRYELLLSASQEREEVRALLREWDAGITPEAARGL